MSNQGIKQYGTYYNASMKNGATAYVNLSKQYDNVHFAIPLYSSKYKISPIKLSLIYTSSNTSIDYYFQTGFKLSIIKELSYDSSVNKYVVTNADMSTEDYPYQNSRYENKELVSYVIIENNQYKVVYKDSVYTFNSSFKLILIEDRDNSINKINFNYTQGYLVSIENNYDEKISFSKTSSQVSVQVTKSNVVVYNIYMAISSSRINNIRYCVYKNSDEEYDKIQLSYSSYLEIYNTYSKERIRIKHPTTNTYKVLEGNTSTEATLRETSITFMDNYETYINYNNMYTYYYFDDRGIINHIVDHTKSIIGYKFDESKNLIYKSNLFKNNYQHQEEIGNLIDDGFFPQSTASWNSDYASLSVGTNYASHINVTSPYCLYISNNNTSYSNTSRTITVSGTPQDIYTFRCMTNFFSINSGSKINVYLIKGSQSVQTISYNLEGKPSCYFFNLVEIKPLKSFDKIMIEFHINGTGAYVSVESVSLTKQIPGTFYEYDESNEVVLKTTGISQLCYYRDSNHKIKSSSSKYNVSCCDYNNISNRDNNLVVDNYLKKQSGLFGTYTSYIYNNTNQVTDIKHCMPKYSLSVSRDKALMIRKKYYYQVGHEYISRIRTEDKDTRYVDDGTKHYLLRLIRFPNDTRCHYTYNSRNNLTSIRVNQSDTPPTVDDNSIAYDSSNLEVASYLDKISNKIEFTYNNDNMLSSARIIDANNNYKELVDIKYVNESISNQPHLSLIKSKQYGISGDKFTFDYDNKYNLSMIKYRAHGTTTDTSKYIFGYDSYNRLSAVTDGIDEYSQNIYYDIENRVNKIIEGTNTYNLIYDNEGEIDYLYNQEQNYKLYQSFNNFKKCNERSPEKFYNFVKTLNLDNSNCNCYSCFFDESTEAYQVITRVNNLTSKGENGQTIIGAVDSSNNRIAKTIDLIPELELGANDSNRLCYDLSLLNTKTIITYLNGDSGGTLLSATTNNNDIIEVYKSSDGLQIAKNGVMLSNPISVSFSASRGYVVALIIGNGILRLLINDLMYYYSLSYASFTSLKYGKTSLTTEGHIKLNGIIVTSIADFDSIKLLSKEGYNALYESVYDKGNFCAASVEETILVNKDLTEAFTVFPFNNSFESINGNNSIKLIEYTKRSNSLDSDDFIFNNKNDKYSLLLDYNKIVYKTNLSDEGTIIANFTISEYSLFSNAKVLFRLYNSSTEIALLISINKKIWLKLNDYNYDLGYYINNYNFNKIGFSYKVTSNAFKYNIYINDETNGGTKSVILNVNNSFSLQLGNNDGLTTPLNGYMEMLCINDSFNDLTYISNYIDKINTSNYLTAYDELGRIKGKKIRVDHNTPDDYQQITIGYNKYEYEVDEDDETNLTTRIKSEAFSINNSSPFTHDYIYNDNCKVTNILNNNSSVKEYKYDLYGRLEKDKNYYNGIYKQNNYEYDGSGNITKRIKSGSNITTETLNYEYGYVNNDNHLINKNALVRIKDANNNIIEQIAYDNYMDSLPVSITKNNVTSLLNWEGMKLKSYGNISYDYDYLGRRISKQITGGKSYKYNYDIRGNMVSEEITSNNVTTIIRYLYDVNNNVYGLIYNGNIYYYVKNILGEILYIINDSGYIEVEYNYDAFGNILSISGTMSTTLGNNNHIVYKSYYIDYENDLYYLKSRYYNPNWGRFISSDKIEYLDPSVVGGLNLYCYCLNDPVMNSDPEGTSILLLLYLAAVAFATYATIHDAVQLASGNVAVKPDATTENNVEIANSNKIWTPWMRYGYSLYLNYVNPETKDVIKGTSIGVEFEWTVHNVAYRLLNVVKNIGINEILGKTIDERIDQVAHVDVGKTIYDDEHGVLSYAMQFCYFSIHPFANIWDYNLYTEGRAWLFLKK